MMQQNFVYVRQNSTLFCQAIYTLCLLFVCVVCFCKRDIHLYWELVCSHVFKPVIDILGHGSNLFSDASLFMMT